MVTMPSEKDFRSPDTGPLLEKYLKGRKGVSTENRMRILRLIENMTLGRNAVGYLTESMHGAGSPQAQRIQIARQMQLGYKKKLAKDLAGVDEGESAQAVYEQSEYFDRIFGINTN
jgi:4-hydroxybutyryl-CoA dehydratase/vinylacetyl-CoA-Delta-isomerase